MDGKPYFCSKATLIITISVKTSEVQLKKA